MGSSISIYIGPFVEVTGYKEGETIDILRGCVDPECKKHHKESKSRFCSECGHLNEEFESKRKTKEDAIDILMDGDFEDNLTTAGEYKDKFILIPNENTPYSKKRMDLDDGGIVDLQATDSKAEINWFYSKYNKELLLLEKEIGAKFVKVKWGVISYWS